MVRWHVYLLVALVFALGQQALVHAQTEPARLQHDDTVPVPGDSTGLYQSLPGGKAGSCGGHCGGGHCSAHCGGLLSTLGCRLHGGCLGGCCGRGCCLRRFGARHGRGYGYHYTSYPCGPCGYGCGYNHGCRPYGSPYYNYRYGQLGPGWPVRQNCGGMYNYQAWLPYIYPYHQLPQHSGTGAGVIVTSVHDIR